MRALLFLFVLFLTPIASAQTELSARVGLSAATVAGDFATSDDAEVRYGFVGGLGLTFPLRYSFAIRAEALYTQKGFTTEEAIVGGTGGGAVSVESVTFEMTTLDVPLLVVYEVPASRDLGVHVYGGPYFSFELDERLRIEPNLAAVSEESDLFRGTDLGFVFGADVSFVLGSLQPSVEIRYARSLSDQLEEGASALPDATAYNSVVSVLVGIRL